MKRIDITQGTPEWLAWRGNRIGGSDAPVIMGVDPYRTKYQLFQEKTVGLQRQATPAMERGKAMEDEVRQIVKKTHYLDFKPVCFESVEFPWMIASLDGFDERNKIVLEIKCPKLETVLNVKAGDIPDGYVIQIVHNMIVAGANEGILSVYHPEVGCIDTVILRDEEESRKLIEEEKMFFYNHIEPWVAPEITARDKEKNQMNDQIWRALEQEYSSLDRDEKMLKIKKEEVRKKLIELCDGESSEGSLVSVALQSQKGAIDYEAIPELKNVDIEQYRGKTTMRWVIRVKN